MRSFKTHNCNYTNVLLLTINHQKMNYTEDANVFLQNQTDEYAFNITKLGIFILYLFYVIFIVVALLSCFFSLQLVYFASVAKDLFRNQAHDVESTVIISVGTTVGMGIVMTIYGFFYNQDIANSTSEHWYRDVFVLFTIPIVTCLVLEFAVGVILSFIVGVCRTFAWAISRKIDDVEMQVIYEQTEQTEGEDDAEEKSMTTTTHDEFIRDDDTEGVSTPDSLDCQKVCDTRLFLKSRNILIRGVVGYRGLSSGRSCVLAISASRIGYSRNTILLSGYDITYHHIPLGTALLARHGSPD
jgi:hypothetical protein